MGRSPRNTCRGGAVVAVLLCALALLLPSCSGGAADGARGQTPAAPTARPLQPVPDVRPPGFATPPAGSGLSRYQDQRLDWKPCKQGLQCATVLVPLDYSRPDGEAITLTTARRRATAARKLGTLFVNPGGPGGSGVDYVAGFRSTGLEGYDLVGWDPRGVGLSTPVSCAGADLDRLLSMDISPDNASEQQALVEADRALGQACLTASGPLLQHISTVEVARDLDLLRGLLHQSRTNLYGASYGTKIGATYAQLFPGRVGRMVLDGAVNLTEDTSITQAQGFERALDAFADWCAGQSCRLGSTRAEVLATVSALWTRLDSDPIKVGSRRLTQQQALTGVVAVLYGNSAGYRPLLQGLQNAVVNRNGRLLLAYADGLNARSPQGRYGQINYAFPAVRCLDGHDHGIQGETQIAQRAAKSAPTVGPFFGADLQCPMWPVPPAPKLRITGAGAPPIVVVGTTGDPATPYEYAVSMSQQLQSAVLLTFKGVGHTAYGQSECVQQQVNAYLVAGTVPADGTRC